jgi:Ribbon-helix-helix protein, copG family
MARVTVRLTERMTAQLEAKASENGMNRARFLRNLITEAVDGAPVEAPEPPTYDELLELLAEKARQGNVSAIRSLLAREEYEDPRGRLMAEFRRMAEDARRRDS